MFYISNGTRLFFTTVGSGPEVVLLHPTPVHHGFWTPIAQNLSDRYRLILPDLRGHGQSESGQGGMSIKCLGEDVERLLDAEGIERAIFVGASIGSYILYEIWRRMPQRVVALAFCCGKPQPDSAANRAKRQENIEAIRANGTEGFFDQMIVNLVGLPFRQREPAKVIELRAMMNGMTAESVIATQQCLMDRPDSVPILPRILVPVLALAGSEDQASAPEQMRTIPDLVPGAEYQLLEGAGHYAPFEQVATVSRLLRQFLDRVCAAR